jgi:hypothetical protein
VRYASPMVRRKKWLILLFVAAILLLPILFFVASAFFNVFHHHEHCIKMTATGFRRYADEHDGNYPTNSNSFGNALLLLLPYIYETNSELGIRYITAPGDDGKAYEDAYKRNQVIPENECSRVYVQGLSEHSNNELCLLFDKYPTRGGDHFRAPWGRKLREILTAAGSMETVGEEEWPRFAVRQIELLQKEGFDNAEAIQIYDLGK